MKIKHYKNTTHIILTDKECKQMAIELTTMYFKRLIRIPSYWVWLRNMLDNKEDDEYEEMMT